MLGHPRSLFMLFMTEMWERFSFYGMRALLTLYMTMQLFEHLQDPMKKNTAYGIYAAYGALVYATPFLGGIIADKILGYKKSVMFGAVLMAIGHFVMAIENEFWLYVALSFLILGNGFFKPNISSIVGGLYAPGDSKRDGGFTIFYMGINLGAMLAPLLCGYLGETYGWHWGFGLAGVGMLAGLLMFGLDQKALGENGNPSNPALLKKKLAKILPVEYFVYIASFIAVVLFAFLVKHYELMTYVLTPFSIGVILILVVKAFQTQKIARDRIFVILILLFFTTLFWAFFEQAGSSITLFTNSNVDRSILGINIPASLFQSVNPFFILALAPLFSLLWTKMASKKAEPSTPLKFAIGLFLLGLGFVIFHFANFFISFEQIQVPNGDGSLVLKAAVVPLAFLLLGYLLHTMGELCLSPIGLSMVTKLSPKANVAMVMGAWFLSSAMAHHLAGGIAKLTTHSENEDPISYAIEASELDPGIHYSLFSSIKEDLIDAGYQKGSSSSQLMGQSYFTQLSDSLQNCTLAQIVSTADLMMGKISENSDKTMEMAYEKGYVTPETGEKLGLQEKLSLASLLQYNKIFLSLGIVAIISSISLLVLVPFIRKLMHGVH